MAKANSSTRHKAQRTPSKDPYRLEFIAPLVQQLNSLDIDQIADVCIDELTKLMGVKLASLFILDDSSDILHLIKNNHSHLINNIVSLNQNPPSMMIAAVRCKELIVVNTMNAQNKPKINDLQRSFSQNYKTQSCIVAPLICQGRVVGVLNLADKTDAPEFSKEDIVAIELFCQLIGTSIGNINLFEKTQHQAQTDGLTGMLNHITFYETLEAELRRSQRYGGQVSIIMADVDDLKPVNDKFGHRAGDLMIRQISRRIGTCIRQIDIAARYGGDEFAIILPSTSLADAVVVAERMVKTVADTPMIWEENEIKLSISVGVGQYGAGSSPGDVARATDLALYAAKQAGKNTVKIFEPDKIT